MTDDDLDLVRIRPKRIDPDDQSDASLRPEDDAGDQQHIESAELLVGDRRFMVTGRGMTIGSAADADVVIATANAGVQAEVLPAAGGYVLAERGGVGGTYVNGEALVSGERRPLRRGDAIAVAGEVIYYLAGAATRSLAPVRAVEAGHVRAGTDSITIGRAVECDLVLDHPTISLHHALIKTTNGVATIEDLGSAVGVRVNGSVVKKALLEVGDRISIGPYSIVFDGEDLFERTPTAGLALDASAVRVDVEGGTILQATDLKIRAGELVAIIGESGAGKTTLLRALSGVSSPTFGTVLVGGEPVAVRQSDLGYVPQFDIVHDQLTVEEALDYSAKLRLPADTSQQERATRVGEVLQELSLDDRSGLRVDRLSGGQRKRVGVGVELLHRPGVLFLDEPTTGLDPGLEHHMSKLFRQLADSGQTVVLVTHATGSMALYDRVVVMGRGGFMRFDGAPSELLEAYRVDQYDDVYEALAEGAQPQAPIRVEGLQRHPANQPSPAASRRVQQSGWYQTRVLTSRYARLLSRDRRHLRSAAIQVPILGVFTAILFHGGVFNSTAPVTEASQAGQLLFLMVTIAIWLGAIASAREIVKERSVLDREIAVGVRIPAYVASKVAVLVVFVSLQVLAFVLIVLLLRPAHASGGALLSLLTIMLFAGAIAVLMGLAVSALAGSQDQATGVIPLLLVPQLLFGGAIVQAEAMTVPVKALSYLVPSRWAYAAAGTALGEQARIDADPVFSRVSHYGTSFFDLSVGVFIAIALVFLAALAASTIALLSRPSGQE